MLSLAVMQQMQRRTPCTSGCSAINQIAIVIQQLLNGRGPIENEFFLISETWATAVGSVPAQAPYALNRMIHAQQQRWHHNELDIKMRPGIFVLESKNRDVLVETPEYFIRPGLFIMLQPVIIPTVHFIGVHQFIMYSRSQRLFWETTKKKMLSVIFCSARVITKRWVSLHAALEVLQYDVLSRSARYLLKQGNTHTHTPQRDEGSIKLAANSINFYEVQRVSRWECSF